MPEVCRQSPIIIDFDNYNCYANHSDGLTFERHFRYMAVLQDINCRICWDNNRCKQ
jgi:hypothetical protein